MLKSDQQEKVLTTTMIHFNVNHEHLKDPFHALMDPNQQIKQQDPFQKPQSDGSSIPITPNLKPWEHK
jgi:hypothetical protein